MCLSVIPVLDFSVIPDLIRDPSPNHMHPRVKPEDDKLKSLNEKLKSFNDTLKSLNDKLKSLDDKVKGNPCPIS